MDLNALTAISPIDGRYRKQVTETAAYFSEYALIRYRVLVEVEYFIALCELPLPQLQSFDSKLFEPLRDTYRNFSMEDAQHIKQLESKTNHDVKAVEYFLKEKFEGLGIAAHQEFIHFGLTSQDINNTAIPLLLKDACQKVIDPILETLIGQLTSMANDWQQIPMLAFTHGQPASPTNLGKEMAVFAYRLEEQHQYWPTIPFPAKFGGATGNLNAHYVAYPAIDWHSFAQQFVEGKLGLKRSALTTQIENYDHLAAQFDHFKRLSIILTDYARDMWQYISMGYFKQKIKKDEVGSSAMPHKVNPIDFENAEGNLGIAVALFSHLAAKLPISRLQRDLTDSTVLRNVGVPFAHLLISINSLLKGMGKLEISHARIAEDLENNWAVVAEALQTILRREGYPKPYEALKELTRTNEKITQQSLLGFIDQLNVSEGVKEEMKAVTPFNYTGKSIGRK